MSRDHTGATSESRRHFLAASASAATLSATANVNVATAGRDHVRKHRIKDIKRELQRMGADVEDLEALANTLGNIPGMESLEVELRTVIWNLDSKRRLALSI